MKGDAPEACNPGPVTGPSGARQPVTASSRARSPLVRVFTVDAVAANAAVWRNPGM